MAPYLRKIDAERWYSNNGPLVKNLEARFASLAGVPATSALATASCTAALTACLRVLAPEGGRCLMPAFTFPATAAAAVAAGLQPVFSDVDPVSWSLTPGIASNALDQLDNDIALVLPVSPFGAPVDTTAWRQFADAFSVPVVIDAAAGADAVISRRIDSARVPVCISLHATKIIGCGEGGMILLPPEVAPDGFRAMVNFGFRGSRQASLPGFNGKMSEYHAAVAHAALDEWPVTRPSFIAASSLWRSIVSDRVPSLHLQNGFGTDWISSTLIADVGSRSAREISGSLSRRGIGSRRWWEDGCHRHPAYRDLQALPCSVTEDLADRLIGLPFFVDITPPEVEETAAALANMLTDNI